MPEGDAYFDNVGGPITDAVIPLLNPHARLSISRQIPQYNLEKRREQGPRWLWDLIVKQARVEGFLVFQFADRFAAAATEMASWIREGKLNARKTSSTASRTCPAFIGMLHGDNTGKRPGESGGGVGRKAGGSWLEAGGRRRTT